MDDFIDIFESVLIDGTLCLCGMRAAEVEMLGAQSRLLLERYIDLDEIWLATIIETEHDRLAIEAVAGSEGAKVWIKKNHLADVDRNISLVNS